MEYFHESTVETGNRHKLTIVSLRGQEESTVGSIIRILFSKDTVSIPTALKLEKHSLERLERRHKMVKTISMKQFLKEVGEEKNWIAKKDAIAKGGGKGFID